MNKKYLLIFSSFLILAGCSTQPPTTETSTPSPSASVQDQPSTSSQQIIIANFAYGPASITVKPGTTVTWTNQDSVPHDVIPDSVSEKASNFGSDLLAQGETYSYTFTTSGTFNYYCSLHPMMKASVTVAE